MSSTKPGRGEAEGKWGTLMLENMHWWSVHLYGYNSSLNNFMTVYHSDSVKEFIS